MGNLEKSEYIPRNMHSPITIPGRNGKYEPTNKSVIFKNLPPYSSPGPEFIGECYQIFKEELTLSLFKLFQNIE